MTIDEELQKYILKQHQRRAIAKIIKRVLEGKKKKGLIWHTQGAYKSLTIIVSADELRKIPELENPTILIVVDRIELEHQIYQNFQAYSYPNIVRAESKNHLKELLKANYRGLIITTIHKFEGMPKHINTRENKKLNSFIYSEKEDKLICQEGCSSIGKSRQKDGHLYYFSSDFCKICNKMKECFS